MGDMLGLSGGGTGGNQLLAGEAGGGGDAPSLLSGGGVTNLLTNPLFLASLKMMGNNTPRVGQPVNTFEGVPELLASTGKTQQERNALVAALIQSGMSPQQAQAYAANPTAAKMALDSVQRAKAGAFTDSAIKGAPGWGDSGATPTTNGPRSDAAPAAATEQMASLFQAKEQENGLPSGFLAKTANIESKFDPNAQNKSGATGLFQFMPQTAAQYGLSNPRDPVASTDAAARLAKDNAETLRSALGRDPTAGELYLAHQQGAGGAARLLSNPDAPVSRVVPLKNVVANGGSPDMTAGQFASMWTSKVDGSQASPQEFDAQLTRARGMTADASGQATPSFPPLPRISPLQPLPSVRASARCAGE
jgi:hypothetical protein